MLRRMQSGGAIPDYFDSDPAGGMPVRVRRRRWRRWTSRCCHPDLPAGDGPGARSVMDAASALVRGDGRVAAAGLTRDWR
jgi:hypothetical protein